MTLLYIYISIFTIYFMLLVVASMKKVRKVRDKYTPKDANLCVVIYASGVTDTLENLIKQLKNQTYSKQNYTIYTILDKCENVSEVTLQSDLNVNVININNLEPVGKSQAYSIVAEKLQDVKDLDAYVFLDSKNYVDFDFLENVNYYLTKYDVFNPTINYLPQDGSLTFWENVKTAYSKYMYKFIYKTRTILGFTNILNTDSFIIKKTLLNQIASFNYRDIISEAEYTCKLADAGVNVAVIDDLKVYDSIDKFDFRIPSLSKRFELFKSKFFKSSNFLTKEFLLSLTLPNWLTCILGYYLLLKHSYVFPFIVGYSTILISFIFLMLAFCMSLLNSKISSKEFLYLFMYPVYSIYRLIYNFPIFRGIRSIIAKTTKKSVIESEVVNAFVSDGKNEYPCQLVLISDDGLAKVTFVNNGKKYTTKNNYIRMIDALKEISVKLNEHGLTLKVCLCCKYFQPLVDGSTNMVKGTCNCQFAGRTPGDMIPTLIWNTCPKFEENNVVSLF